MKSEIRKCVLPFEGTHPRIIKIALVKRETFRTLQRDLFLRITLPIQVNNRSSTLTLQRCVNQAKTRGKHTTRRRIICHHISIMIRAQREDSWKTFSYLYDWCGRERTLIWLVTSLGIPSLYVLRLRTRARSLPRFHSFLFGSKDLDGRMDGWKLKIW